MFLGGGRAALLQLAHPMVAHDRPSLGKTRTSVVGRFQRTFKRVRDGVRASLTMR
ncbi:MAG: hypothetical protein IPQ07_20915 [Myxococcales bacterium]|nr:hypothetical protein [Myxococcales bacterium]